MKIKVLMLPKWYPSRLDIAEGNYVERHVRAISADANVAVLYVHSDSDAKSDYEIEYRNEESYPVVRVYFKKFSSPFSFFTKAINLYRYVIAQKRGYHLLRDKFGSPDLSHVHVLTRTCFFALYLKWTAAIPFIISEHWSGFLRERKAFGGLLKPAISKWLAAKSAAITCVSDAQKNGMVDYGFSGPFHIIPNVVDTDLFKPILTKKNAPSKRIIHISRLDSHPKNLPGILRATKLLSGRRTDFELHLIGTGAEAEKQKRLSQELQLANKVFFHGHKSHAEVAELLCQSSFLVVFSNYETQSCAILEAFSCGLPVIGTDVGGIPEILHNERGRLIEKGDEKELAKAMDEMLDSYMNFKCEEIHDYAVAHFSAKVIGTKFLTVYNEVLAV